MIQYRKYLFFRAWLYDIGSSEQGKGIRTEGFAGGQKDNARFAVSIPERPSM